MEATLEQDGIGSGTLSARTQAQKLRALTERVTLFHTPGGDAYADIPLDGRIETCEVNSRTFKDWLYVEYDEVYGGSPSNNAMQEAVYSTAARARLKGEEREVYLRLAWHDNALYLDMCNAARQVIEVTADGWRILSIDNAPVRFRRTPDMLARPLPTPERGGSIDRVFEVLNIPDEASRILVKGFLLGMLHPTGPYPGLALYGEQGSAKSCAARYIRSVIDPTAAPTTGDPKDIETVALQANANWVPVIDNVRTVRDWLADALCRLATGSAYNKRTQYENTGLTVIKTKRPFMLTSIADAIQQPDLINRVLTVRLPVIPKKNRKPEDATDAQFAAVHPEVLGGLLDATVVALRGYKTVELDELPRMADVAKWVTAAEPAMSLKPGMFIQAYAGNETDAYEAAINSNPVAQAVVSFMQGKPEWVGTPTDLYQSLSAPFDVGARKKPVGWPVNAKVMSDKLNEAAPALRARYHISIERVSLGHERGLRLERTVDGGDSQNPDDHLDDATDAQIYTFSPWSRKEEEREEEKPRKVASVASVASESDDWLDDDF